MSIYGDDDRLPQPAMRVPGAPVRPSDVPTAELVEQLVARASRLARKEVELAKVELQKNVQAELSAAKGLGVASICALTAFNLLCVAVALLLARWMPAWGGAVLVAAMVMFVGTIAGIWGWRQRVRAPLEATRRTLQEDLRWAKERIG